MMTSYRELYRFIRSIRGILKLRGAIGKLLPPDFDQLRCCDAHGLPWTSCRVIRGVTIRYALSDPRPFPADLMRMCPISTRVNTPENDDPSIIEPIELAPDAA
jgi:hypothetical protein